MTGDSGEIDRKTFFSRGTARAIELAATIPLIGLLIDNFSNSRKYYEANLSKAFNSGKPVIVSELYLEGDKFLSSLKNLAEVYEDEYYETYTTLETRTDAEGNTHIETVTHHRWVEPRGVPDHDVVFSWADKQKDFQRDLEYLVSRPVIDGNKIDNISVDEKNANRVGQGILSSIIFGSEIALLLGYEEIFANMSYDGYETISLSEKVRRTNTSSQINRRCFFKIGAALAGAYTAHKISLRNQRKSEEGKGKLENELDNIVSKADMSPENSFLRYFGIRPSQLINQAQSYVTASTRALENRIREKRVARAFEEVVNQGRKYIAYLKDVIANVPEDLSAMTTYGYITKEIKKLSEQQSTRANLGILVEGLVLGGVMAAILIPAEYINKKIG